MASEFHQKWHTQKQEILTHCRRELMHEVWKSILDDEFIQAYHYGIVIKCVDGIERRIYPRFFTYSADYPEKSVTPRLLCQFNLLILHWQSTACHNSRQRNLSVPKMPCSKVALGCSGNAP